MFERLNMVAFELFGLLGPRCIGVSHARDILEGCVFQFFFPKHSICLELGSPPYIFQAKALCLVSCQEVSWPKGGDEGSEMSRRDPDLPDPVRPC